MVLITQQSAETDAAAQDVVNRLTEAHQSMAGNEWGSPYFGYRRQLAASQLRIERSLMAQQ